jgi:hypothetical protein
MRGAVASVLLVTLVAAAYLSGYAEAPITLREARVNSRGRMALEDGLANALAQLPRSSTVLMYGAEHASAIRMAGIPLRHLISENAHPEWELALLDPSHAAAYAVACKGDPIWAAVREHQAQFESLATVSAPGQASCTLYRTKQR